MGSDWHDVAQCVGCGRVVFYRSNTTKKWWPWGLSGRFCFTCGERGQQLDVDNTTVAAWVATPGWFPWEWGNGHWVLRDDVLAKEDMQQKLRSLWQGGEPR